MTEFRLRFEALTFESIEDADTAYKCVDHFVSVNVKQIGQNVPLFVFANKHAPKLTRLLNQYAGETARKDVFRAETQETKHVQ